MFADDVVWSKVVLSDPGSATTLYGIRVVADWRESVLCEGMCEHDADALLAMRATISKQAAEIERLRDSLLESCSKYEAMKVGWRAALNQKETPNGNH